MTDQPIVYKRTDAAGQIYGVPNNDLTQRDVDRLGPGLRREVLASALYAEVGTDEVLDPLGELDNAAYEALSPPEKGSRTREAKKRAVEAEAAREDAQQAAEAVAADDVEVRDVVLDTGAATDDAGDTGQEGE